MDRDIVNALHILYQNGATKRDELLSKLWCGPDSAPDLEDLTKETDGGIQLCKHLIRFIKAVEGQLANLPRPDYAFGIPLSQKPRVEGEPRPAFIAMPYDPSWFQPVRDVIVNAAKTVNFTAEISKDLVTPGPITDQIWQGIRRSDVVLADISVHNPNVFYELGIAHALGKETILITHSAASSPFDIFTARLIPYDTSDLSTLESSLVDAFNAVSARYKYEGDQPYF